ncbi:PP2C family protein-serine/threonine phosphatase, partial [Leptospira ellisii]
MNFEESLKVRLQRLGWFTPTANLVFLASAGFTILVSDFSFKERIVFGLISIALLYLVNYVFLIFILTKRVFPSEEVRGRMMKRYRKGDDRMQNYLFPPAFEDEHYEIFARTLTYNPIGGDFYNFLRDSRGNYWIGIGDSVGHGYLAGLFSMMIFQHMSILVHTRSEPYDVIEEINEKLARRIERYPSVNSSLYATFLLIKADAEGSVEHSGLHPSFVHYKNETRTTELVETDGKFISTTMNASLKNVQGRGRFGMKSGDIVFCFTDGLYEQKGNGNLYFGENLFRFINEVPK